MPGNWSPDGGWRVDRALVFAHALQESNFRTNVVSPAGARGLMQVMPATAQYIARKKGTVMTGSLSSPSTNMEYGQSYIEQLRDMAQTGGLLPKVIAAYNAGPAPLDRWNMNEAARKDPLLYIESIPYWETRGYVTIVLRNYWMYQQQVGPANSEPHRAGPGNLAEVPDPSKCGGERRPECGIGHQGGAVGTMIDESLPFIPVSIALLTDFRFARCHDR